MCLTTGPTLRSTNATNADFPGSCSEIEALARAVKETFPEKNIWLWTGYILESLDQAQRRVLRYVDALIDGPFIRSRHDATLPFRSSANQRILEGPYDEVASC